MKAMKKLLALMLALVLCAAMALPAFAAKGENKNTFKLTINEPIAGHKYNIYQIFTGDVSGTGATKTLSNVKYGKNYIPAGSELGDPVPEAALKAIEDARTFAEELVGTAENPGTLTARENPFTTLTADTNGKYEVDVPGGYYLIVDVNEGADLEDSYSAFVMQIINDEEVTPKNSTPTNKKTLQDSKNPANWTNASDYDINQSFQSKLTATLAADPDYGAYPEYKLVFRDKMSKGLTFESIESVTLTPNGGAAITIAADGGYTLDFSKLTDNKGDGKNEWTLTIADLKQIKDAEGNPIDITAGLTVDVIYNAHLNDEAEVTKVSGVTGNNNAFTLDYSNDPEGEGTGSTKEDKVYPFTFGIDGFKFVMEKNEEGVDKEAAKAGAGFTLYDKDGNVIPLYQRGTNYYKYSGDVKDIPDGGVELNEEGHQYEMVTGDDGLFHVEGLKAGTYTLKETRTPVGFNTCAEITVVIDAEYEESTEDVPPQVTLTYTIDGEEKSSDLKIENKAGSMLPSTGGIGTTIFYAVGAVLVVGAGVLLFVRKRMGSKG